MKKKKTKKTFKTEDEFLDWYMRTPLTEQEETEVVFDYHNSKPAKKRLFRRIKVLFRP